MKLISKKHLHGWRTMIVDPIRKIKWVGNLMPTKGGATTQALATYQKEKSSSNGVNNHQKNPPNEVRFR